MTQRTAPLDAGAGLERLAGYPFAIVSWVDDAGFPVSVATSVRVHAATSSATFAPPEGLVVPIDRVVSLTGSHIHPQPGYGYDERRHVTVWGRITDRDDELELIADRAWGWDEAETPFFEYAERSTGQSKRYFDALSRERGTPVRPRLSLGFLALRTTRLPFLSATIVPVLLGILVAARQGSFDLPAAVLTIIGASFVQLAVNVSNDVFDTIQGTDDINVTPTQFSGGSRVIQYGLVSLRQMTLLAAGFALAALTVGLVLLATRGSQELLVIGIAGFVIGLGYTAPPLKFAYRGLGEIAVAVGFGPLMLLGAYVVQTGGSISSEAVVASIPIAILVALILYVNEIPDRRADARAHKRTLPVRLRPSVIVAGYRISVAAAYVVVVAAVAARILPVPTLLMLLTIPLAVRVASGLTPNYDNPYGLMAVMGVNVKLHLYAGALLGLGYAVVLIVAAVAP
jgi:1,4-dihydroxy-2-naphthoate octaprenyltransferase